MDASHHYRRSITYCGCVVLEHIIWRSENYDRSIPLPIARPSYGCFTAVISTYLPEEKMTLFSIHKSLAPLASLIAGDSYSDCPLPAHLHRRSISYCHRQHWTNRRTWLSYMRAGKKDILKIDGGCTSKSPKE
jgi:hypothetical protein